jgi:hypothetical protein
MGIQVRLQGEPYACGHEGCMCALGLQICWETRGSLWDNLAFERSALARLLISVADIRISSLQRMLCELIVMERFIKMRMRVCAT